MKETEYKDLEEAKNLAEQLLTACEHLENVLDGLYTYLLEGSVGRAELGASAMYLADDYLKHLRVSYVEKLADLLG